MIGRVRLTYNYNDKDQRYECMLKPLTVKMSVITEQSIDSFEQAKDACIQTFRSLIPLPKEEILEIV